MPSILVDTCALIFLTLDENQSGRAKGILQRAYEASETVFVSPISAWEIGLLVSRGRLNLSSPPLRWFSTIVETPGISMTGLTPEVLIASSFLPDAPFRDPADRIMASTAREYGLTLLTRDKQLLAYADQGHIRALPC